MSDRTVVIERQSQALPALVSFFIPGLGHLIQGRILMAIVWWVILIVAALSIFIAIGVVFLPLAWLGCVIDTALYKPKLHRYRV